VGRKMEKILFNGEVKNRDEIAIDIEDRGYQFGDGIYEVIRIYNGKMFTANEHLTRLYESAEKIQMAVPFEFEELKSKLAELVKTNGLIDGIIYLQLTRGTSLRQHHFPSEPIEPTFVAYTRDFVRPITKMENGVSVKLVEDIRWLRCDIKSLNLLGNLLAKQEAAAVGGFEAIQHRGETVTEGSSSNVFIIKNGELITHPATNLILNGITRRCIIDICHQNGIKVNEEPFTVNELMEADEIFIASTTSEVMPIVKIDEVEIATGKPGEVTKTLQNHFNQLIVKNGEKLNC
jgi:D-alanine transaminase